MRAKQKLKGYYGDLTEKQFRRIFNTAEKERGDTGEKLIGLLERRLDAVVYRAKFVPTVFAARQFVNHGHVLVNGKKVDIPSYSVKEGDIVKGKVVVVADYGVFVEIQTGVEALVHVSEMSWSTHLKSAGDFYKIGDSIEAKILTLNRDERKMSLGVKQLTEDPWVIIDKKYFVDSRHTVKVRNFTNFGIFVELEEGVDGLVHISDLSWTKKIKHPAEFTNIGESIDVIVLEVDIDNRRISLGKGS